MGDEADALGQQGTMAAATTFGTIGKFAAEKKRAALCAVRGAATYTIKSFSRFAGSSRPGESIADYITELRRLSEHCGFGSTLDDMLRDRLVYAVVSGKNFFNGFHVIQGNCLTSCRNCHFSFGRVAPHRGARRKILSICYASQGARAAKSGARRTPNEIQSSISAAACFDLDRPVAMCCCLGER
ncbi:hypothetical protein HPB47_016714, partial [Ixodes persulcatus]